MDQSLTVSELSMLRSFTFILVNDAINTFHLSYWKFYVLICMCCWYACTQIWYLTTLLYHLCIVLHCFHYVLSFYLHYLIWITNLINILKIEQSLCFRFRQKTILRIINNLNTLVRKPYHCHILVSMDFTCIEGFFCFTWG